MNQRLYTLRDVAERANTSKTTICHAIREGLLTPEMSVNYGGLTRLLFTEEEVMRIVALRERHGRYWVAKEKGTFIPQRRRARKKKAAAPETVTVSPQEIVSQLQVLLDALGLQVVPATAKEPTP